MSVSGAVPKLLRGSNSQFLWLVKISFVPEKKKSKMIYFINFSLKEENTNGSILLKY